MSAPIGPSRFLAERSGTLSSENMSILAMSSVQYGLVERLSNRLITVDCFRLGHVVRHRKSVLISNPAQSTTSMLFG